MEKEPVRRRGAGTKGFALTLILAAGSILAWELWPRPAMPPSPEPPERVAAAASPLAAKTPATVVPSALAPAPRPPSLDLVRVDPDGQTLVAGRGMAGSDVVVLIDGAASPPARVDASGQFVTFLSLPVDQGPRVLSLRIQGANGSRIDGTEDVIVAPRSGAAGTTEVASASAAASASRIAAPDAPGIPASARTSSVAASPLTPAPTPPVLSKAPGTGTDSSLTHGSSTPQPAASAPAVLAPAILGPAILAAGPDGLRVPAPATEIVIDSVAYEAEGVLRMGGRSPKGGTVRLYVDGRPVGDVAVDESGDWQVVLPVLTKGVHEARADLIDAGGRVTGRYSLPFAAEDRAALAAALPAAADDAGPVTVATVQPGESLWRISERRYGSGVLYARVFAANRAQIRNPDLIYPGQIFTLPQN